ncbi:LamG-like jellyroll fold domain-containing protein, partial [Niastella vici]|uniref:LamG-like jellyroll fold domain-containing protein n=1 Tax=Niastella vici TaxID=1703345 RepID=UPI00117CE0B4
NAPAKVYYRDNTMADWVDYSNGLPLNFACNQGGIIFYRDSKLRIAGNRGVWESPLFGAGTPVAQPMADQQFISCIRDTVSFIDYSNVNYAGAQWKWTFPGASYVSSTTAREPKVVYQLPGSYTVSLEVTDAAGNKHTRTVDQMITFTRDNCSPDTVAGQCLKMDGSYNSINLGKVNINSNNFSISCWIKPDGLQNALTQLLGHDAYPGPSSWFGLGFAWKGGPSNLELAYTDNLVSWGNESGLIPDTATWNFVVLTYSPTGVTIYLNGVPSKVNNAQMPVIDLSQSPFYISRDLHGQGAAYKGAIDEIKFYNYALTQNEVREKMHLIQSNAATETGLLKYYQFNKYDSAAGVVQDIASSYQALVPASLFIPSTAPVATGKVFRKPNVNSGGQHSFTGTGIDLFLKNGATYPNGEVVAFQLNSPPDKKPDSLSLIPRSGYFIINNYGSNTTFTAPDSIRFNGRDIDAAHGTADFNLYRRSSGAWGDSWGPQISRSTGFNYMSGNSTITFGTGNNVTGFGQFALSALAVKADTVAGKCLKMDGSLTPIRLGKVNINSNNFSISCWIKPDGLQEALSQIIGWNPNPSLGKGFGLGFIFDVNQGYAPNLQLCYTDTIVGWGNTSGLIADTATWNFVVLTYSPSGVKIYLNGVPATVNNGPMPVLNLSQDPFYVNLDIHWQDAAYKGAIDEIKFYNYALSQNEVREKMHLIQSNAAAETGLLKYFQFNQYNAATGTVPDLMSDFKATIPGSAFITTSTAPVATGSVFRKSNVNAGGKHSFTGTGIDIFLKNNATYPNGEVVAFQLNSPPDTKPNSLPLVPGSHYFIINNYGSNKTFTVPDSIRFSGLNIASSNFKATDFKIYKRASCAWGSTWSTDVRQAARFAFSAGNSSITFNNQSNVTSFGQFAISAPSAARVDLAVTPPVNAGQPGDAITNVEFYPNPNKGWGYLNITSPHDNAHVNLYLQDMNGNTVYQASEQINSSNKSTFMLNFSALTSGTYLLQIRFNTGELITKKVTIIK